MLARRLIECLEDRYAKHTKPIDSAENLLVEGMPFVKEGSRQN